MQTIERAGGTDLAASDLERPNVVLEITRGRARQRSRPVPGATFLIGSAADCDLVLGDLRFEAVHSYLFVSQRGVTIRQVALDGPTLCVGGREVSWASLADFDRLQMGLYEFRVRIQWPQGQQADNPATCGPQRARPPLVDDPASERLLQAVEQFAAVPQLSLFVGDASGEGEPPEQTPPADPPWQPRLRQAGY